MNVNRYEGLSLELPVTVPLLDVILIILIFLMLAGPVPGETDSATLTVTDQSPTATPQTLQLRSDGTLYYRGNRLTVDDLPETLTTADSSVTLLIGPGTDFQTIQQALGKLHRAGLSPEVRILVPPE